MSRLSRCLIHIFSALATALLLGPPARAEILYEQGSLRGFLGGSCPDCGYDNWISHISEGIARPGYNDYGPIDLDPQENGFGQYWAIPDGDIGDSLIADWYRMTSALWQGDTTRVESLLVATQLDSLYELVILQDSARVYYLLREQLKLAYYDDQGTPFDSTDDVRGSFNAGWGVYVYSPLAIRPMILVEAPHPEDDYITPFISTDVYELFDAGALMITGAGREVLWNHDGNYDNSKSLSDPSRIERSVFQMAHRAFADLHPDDFSLQLHSYDSAPHLGLKSLVVSAGPDDSWPNEPVMDPCAYDDMMSLTPAVAVPANTAGNHPDVHVNDYYCVFYGGGYHHQGDGPEIPTTWDLMGYGSNRQIAYSHVGHNAYRSSENILHIEMDEMPDAILDSMTVYYRTDLPGVVTFANYQNALAYYRPAYQALLAALQCQPMVARVGAIPNYINFGATTLDDTLRATLRFQNILPFETIHVNNVHTSDPAFSVVNPPSDFTLTPGQVCTLRVQFHPYDSQTFYGAVTLDTDSGCSDVGLRGDGLAPLAFFLPDSINFDSLELGDADTVTVLLHNPGYLPLHVFGFISAGLNARILAPPDSLVPARTDDTLRVLITPQNIAAMQCSVAVISDAFNADTAWLDIWGVGTAYPMSVSGLTAHRLNNHMVLRWQRVRYTDRGIPLPAAGYMVLAQSGIDDSTQILAFTPDTVWTDVDAVVNHPRRLYYVIAYYTFSPTDPPALRPVLGLPVSDKAVIRRTDD